MSVFLLQICWSIRPYLTPEMLVCSIRNERVLRKHSVEILSSKGDVCVTDHLAVTQCPQRHLNGILVIDSWGIYCKIARRSMSPLWLTNIGSGNGLMLSGNQPLPGLTFTRSMSLYVVTRLQWCNSYIWKIEALCPTDCCDWFERRDMLLMWSMPFFNI